MNEEIIGREHEISVVDRFLSDDHTRPSALLLEGEPGIGKSILWRYALEQAQPGTRVCSSRPTSAETELSFVVLNDLLGALLNEGIPTISAPRRRALEIALLREEGSGHSANAQGVAFGALDVLHAASESQPILLAIDDAHWIDQASESALRFCLRRLERERIAIILASRAAPTSDTIGRTGSPTGLTGSEIALERIELGPLSLAAIQRVLTTRIGVSTPRHILVRIHELSGGNPFYALEIARGLARKGMQPAPHEALPLPDSLSDLVRDRIDSLSPETQSVLRWVSALPKPACSVLETVAGADAFDDRLREAVDAGILDLEDGSVRFTHPLLSFVVYARTEEAERRTMHDRLADVVHDPEERSRHLALATTSADESVAAIIESGARRAATRGAPSAAAALLEQAVRITPPSEHRKRHLRVLEAIDLHLEVGEAARALELANEDAAELEPGPMRASVLYRKAIIHGRLGNFSEEERLLLEASAEAGQDPLLQAQIQQELALLALVTRSDLSRALAYARDSLAWAERAEDPGILVTSLVALAGHAFMMGEGVRVDLLGRAESVQATATGLLIPRLPLLDLNVCWGILLKWADDFDASRSKLEHRYRDALEAGEENLLPFVLYHLSELECWAGSWGLAERYAQDAMREAMLSEQLWMQPPSLYSMALIDAHMGRIEQSRREAEEAFAASEQAGILTIMVLAKTVLGFLELSRGDAQAADQHLRFISDVLAAMGTREPGIPRYQADAIEARIGIGELETAAPLLEEFERMGRAVDRPWALATSARCRALLEAANGDLDAATSAIERAMIEHQRLAMPFELGRTLMVEGVIHRRSKRKKAAGDALRRSLDIFESLGSPLWANKARAELGRIGIRPSSEHALTPAEERVAELVSIGQTNREVADALFMSVKTVDSHLSKIYRKLNVRSRTELARMYGRSDERPRVDSE